MGTTPALAALQIGLDASRIKMALRHKMEQTGMPYTTSDTLIEAVLGLQMGEEDAESNSSGDGHVNFSESESEEEENQAVPPRLVTLLREFTQLDTGLYIELLAHSLSLFFFSLSPSFSFISPSLSKYL